MKKTKENFMKGWSREYGCVWLCFHYVNSKGNPKICMVKVVGIFIVILTEALVLQPGFS